MPAQQSITLPPVLDISAAPTLLVSCKDLQDHAEPVTIDASGVERITTPAMQVLVSFIKTRKNEGRATAISDASAPFHDASTSLGLSAFFKEEAAHG